MRGGMLKNCIEATAAVTLASLVMALIAIDAAQPNDKIVKIDAGMIEGAVSGDGLSFKGIPYAAPPLGASRRRAPQPRREVHMTSRLLRVTSFTIAIVASHPVVGRSQQQAASWLDQPKPASWNTPGLPIPVAPRIQRAVDPRCRDQARPPQLEEDTRVHNQGWDLIGAYQGGWQILVIRGTAGYDGMCRPRQYQDFVFVRGVFAGTLSPQAMDSRTDGALGWVFLQSDRRLTAEYARYAATDPLCCPSRTTTVVFDVATEAPILRPVSSSTSKR